MSPSATPLLSAATPAEWLAVHLGRFQARHDDPEGDAGPVRGWVGMRDLFADDAAFLRAQHARICSDEGATPAAAAKWLASGFAGKLARSIGFTLATGAAGLLAEPETIRWRLSSDSWPDRVDFGAVEVAVAPDHPWADQAGVRVLATEEAVAAAATRSLVAAASPIVDAVRPLARVGRNALWSEVADALGLALLHNLDLPVAQAALDRLGAALDAPGHPWRKLPEVKVGRAAGHPVYLGRKGGCCLYYQCPAVPQPEPGHLTERELAWLERFPRRPEDPHYCSTCSLLDPAASEARQLFWWELERLEQATPS